MQVPTVACASFHMQVDGSARLKLVALLDGNKLSHMGSTWGRQCHVIATA